MEKNNLEDVSEVFAFLEIPSPKSELACLLKKTKSNF